MAEFCYKCLNKHFGLKLNKNKFVYSKEPEICEGCGEYKNVVICEKSIRYYCYKFRVIIIIFCIVFLPLTILSLLTYSIYWRLKLKISQKKKNKKYRKPDAR